MPGGARSIQYMINVTDPESWSPEHTQAFQESGATDPLEWAAQQIKGNMQAVGNSFIAQNSDMYSGEMM